MARLRLLSGGIRHFYAPSRKAESLNVEHGRIDPAHHRPTNTAGQQPQSAQEVIDWLEQTVTGWNADPTPFVWNGKRRRRRERARRRRLGGSGAALLHASSLPVDPLA
jgi:hypothetical protein